jgi:hypothetical protein
MRVPQVNERIKEAPAQALRGVFAGIGQLLLITDKLRNKTPFGQQAPYARAPEPPPAAAPRPAPAEPVAEQAPPSAPAAQEEAVAEPTAAETMAPPTTPKTPRPHRPPKTPWASAPPAETRDFDKTGNVRLITPGDAHADDEPAPAAQPEAEPVAAAAEPTPAPAPAEEPAPVATAEPAATPADPVPPLPNYGELSVASLRARLRNLDATQVRGLVEYEKAHAGRAEVIAMFERRITKLETGE